MDFSKEDYCMFSTTFGYPSGIKTPMKMATKVPVTVHNSKLDGLQPFSNKTLPFLGERAMPWHADIPNHATCAFPIRTLWMFNNPNPNGGFTSFLNIADSIEVLSKRLQDLIPMVKVTQQDWFKPDGQKYQPGVNVQEFDLLKVHPITGKSSLRLNNYGPSEWISGVSVDGVKQADCSLIQEYIDEIAMHEEMIYTHKWTLHDIIVYDNWNLVHNRMALDLPPDSERLLYRMNIDHFP